ncbi:hypothetical protein [Glycomyces buryatensis]|uniref:Uncharacterized protein n=1 Tax=Glycomyces buryatensis TaxID=2570927 RepID=A0A4S8QAA8_9ACTN|nr:hypothetical protein [Glycomyces buryatensis]THV41413.1 hypothetical protein FAB82_11475 [Glycomyces buryatensis]
MTLVVLISFALSACFGSNDTTDKGNDTSEIIDQVQPCELLNTSDASDVVFGEGLTESWSEKSEKDFIGCDNQIALLEGEEEVGSIDFTARVFTGDSVEPGGASASYDNLGGFQSSGQADMNEVLTSSIDPISSDWSDGEVYLLNGLFRNRELYIVGAWGETQDFAVGLSIRVTAEQDYYDQPLTYHKYCDSTDLGTDCLISAEVLNEWMTKSYLPAVLEQLSSVSAD